VIREHPQFQEFFAAHYPRLRRLGYWLTGDWTEAEELAQEAMVRTWWHWSIVRGHDRPHDYARKVLVNRHRSLLRRTLVRARHAARYEQPSSVAASDPTDALVLWEATRRLPARQRAVGRVPKASGGARSPTTAPNRMSESWPSRKSRSQIGYLGLSSLLDDGTRPGATDAGARMAPIKRAARAM